MTTSTVCTHTRQNDGLDALVVAHHPHGQHSQIQRVDELAQRSPCAEHAEFALLLRPLVGRVVHARIHATDHARNDVADAVGKVIVRPEDVARHNRGEHVAVPLVVRPVRYVD